MRFYFVLFISILCFKSYSQTNKIISNSEISILPKPTSLVKLNGTFTFNSATSISTDNDEQIIASNYLINLFNNASKLNIKRTKKNDASILFTKIKGLNQEAYKLHISPKQIIIKASGAAGFMYAVQSIRQLLPSQIEVKIDDNAVWTIPCVIIEDEPRFKWRAYMLDESRYFHGEDFVKLILDQMASLKMNVFHWHLTDDAGWRIEIKKYPKLTEVGSIRLDTEIETWKSGKTSGKPHSGFYTQEQIKNIVAYAAERNITIVPEFEMPGHSSAAIAAYSWLGSAGKNIDVPITFGRHYDNYDITKPEVVQFVKDVLNEMFELFPSEVIHIGGDEVGYKVWEDSEHVVKFMKENNINTPADLQINFTNNISRFIESKGKRMMGWNEIMGINIHKGFAEKKNDKAAETELAKNVIVHFWKGNLELAKEAAQKGYGIVNSLHSNTYLDYSYKDISLEKAYSFNPIPEGLDQKYHKNIYGLGCQMWSEWTPTNNDVTYQTFPRIAAYAEVGWSSPKNKNFSNFKLRLKELQQRWELLHINYAKVVD